MKLDHLMNKSIHTSVSTSTSATENMSNPVDEIALLLNVTVAQIELAIKESNASVEVLTNSFVDIANGIDVIANNIKQFSKEEAGTVKDDILNGRENLLEKLKDAMVAIQYHDQLSQRLLHISNSLTSMSRVAKDETQLHSKATWPSLKKELRANYSSETETALFDLIIDGADTCQALRQLGDQQRNNEQSGVELF